MGLGVSNLALVRFLLREGARVTVLDQKSGEELAPRLSALAGWPVRFVLGPSYLDSLAEDFAWVFLTPGMAKDRPEIEEARRRGAVISGEMPLFLELCPAPVIGVTGSAGKTTTTTLVARMLQTAGFRVALGGNIGQPLVDKLPDIPPDARVVVELSSFQLQLTRKSPHIGVFLNLRPDHLDVHRSLEEYAEAKRNVYRHQGAGDYAVLNAEDEVVAREAARVPGGLAWFGESRPAPEAAGAWVRAEDGAGNIVFRLPGGGEKPVCPVASLRLVGRHNLLNSLAAVAAASLAGATPEAMAQVLGTFPGVEHRLERVAEIAGALYVNDSIATTPHRALAALRAFPGPLLLIAGGYDKKLGFEALAREMMGKVRHLILMGATARRIREAVEEAARESPSPPPQMHEVRELAEAVRLAHSLAREGDTVLLSPACASYDMFRNYEDRGRQFKRLVEELGGGEGRGHAA